MPLHFRGVATAVLDWLASLPTTVLDARPSLWVRSATLSLMAGQTTGVEEKLQAAEAALAAALQGAEPDDKTRDLIGQIAAARATLALTRYQPEAMITQARRALEYLHPDNLSFRFTANWTLGSAYQFQGDRAAAGRGLYRSHIHQPGVREYLLHHLGYNQPGPGTGIGKPALSGGRDLPACSATVWRSSAAECREAYLGLARIYYEWNDLEAAEQHGQQSLQLARQYDHVIDRFIISEVFLARLKLARGDVAGAAAMLAQAEQSARQNNFVLRMPEIAAAQVLVLLRQGRSGRSRSTGSDSMSSPSARPGCSWPRETRPPRWRAGAIAPADGSQGLAG